MTKKRKRHTPEQIVKKLRDAEVMLNAGKSMEEVLKMLEVSETTFDRWQNRGAVYVVA
jgi:transposase